jgi:hypothetical protein
LAYDTAVENVALVRARHIPVILVTQCRLEEDAHHRLSLSDHGLDALGESLAGPGVYHVSMKDTLSGKQIQDIFANLSGHLHPQGHQALAHAIFEKIEQEQAALGIAGARVAVAGRPLEAKMSAPDPRAVVPRP